MTKIKHRKSNMKQHQTKRVLCDDKVKTYMEFLHRRFVIVTIDKAAKKYALICKRFYINLLLVEFGIFSNSNTKTYLKIDTSKADIVNTNLKYCFIFELTVTDKQKDLSMMY